jgi:hypothetical protein
VTGVIMCAYSTVSGYETKNEILLTGSFCVRHEFLTAVTMELTVF